MKFIIDSIEYDAEPIPGFPKYYATIDGKIISANLYKRTSFKILKPSFGKFGYAKCVIYLNKKKIYLLVHRLICLTFLGKPKERMQVNHKNFIKKDNRIENLEYVSAKQNTAHAVRHKRQRYVNGENNGQSKLKTKEVIEIRKLLKLKTKYKVIQKKFNISAPSISMIKHGRNWKHVKIEE